MKYEWTLSLSNKERGWGHNQDSIRIMKMIALTCISLCWGFKEKKKGEEQKTHLNNINNILNNINIYIK